MMASCADDDEDELDTEMLAELERAQNMMEEVLTKHRISVCESQFQLLPALANEAVWFLEAGVQELARAL